MNKIDLHLKAGLIPVGDNEDGEKEYLGPEEAWDKFEELEEKQEEKTIEDIF